MDCKYTVVQSSGRVAVAQVASSARCAKSLVSGHLEILGMKVWREYVARVSPRRPAIDDRGPTIK
jgi:hypothetical protein